MEDREWKTFGWSCGTDACASRSLRILEIGVQFDHRFVFRTQCPNCAEQETAAFYQEELALYVRDPGLLNRFVYPDSPAEDRRLVSLSPLLSCGYCGGHKLDYRAFRFSDWGVRIECDCFECDRGPLEPRDFSYEEIFRYAEDAKQYYPQVISDWISPGDIDREMLRGSPRPS